ncbi:MAG: hypothetical protein AABX82_09100 [Nanoarchaeota archaeon]
MAEPRKSSERLPLSDPLSELLDAPTPGFARRLLGPREDPFATMYVYPEASLETLSDAHPESPSIYIIDDHIELYDAVFLNLLMMGYVPLAPDLRKINDVTFWNNPQLKPRKGDLVVLDMNFGDATDPETGEKLHLPYSGVQILGLMHRHAISGNAFEHLTGVLVATAHPDELTRPQVLLENRFPIYGMEKIIDRSTGVGSVLYYAARIPLIVNTIYDETLNPLNKAHLRSR